MRKHAAALFVLAALLAVSLTIVRPVISETSSTPQDLLQRRDTLRLKFTGRALVYAGQGDRDFDKNLYYLTGRREAQAVLFMAPGAGNDLLFLKSTDDPARVAAWRAVSGIQDIWPLSELDHILDTYHSWEAALYYPEPPSDPAFDPRRSFYQALVARHPEYTYSNLTPMLAEMRMIKSEEEIALILTAAEITAAGLEQAIRRAKPGMVESELQDIIEAEFFRQGAERTSFDSIIGSGPNSLILHYSLNTRTMRPGDLVVMDVGAEYKEYAGDVTRTIPISGRFTARQKEIYDIVLEAQARAVRACRPGATFADINAAAYSYVDGLGYRAAWWHSVGHSLGLDVHDPALGGFPFAAGMVITIEPGLYLPQENIGIRIEDDVLITSDGCRMLTESLPRRPGEIELLMMKKTSGRTR